MPHFLPASENYTLLFTLAASFAAVELGLTTYLMTAGTHVRGALYHPLQIICLFDALWAVLFLPACVLWFTRGSLDLLANLFGSIFWIFAAAIVWGSTIGRVHNTRTKKSCRADPRCTHYISPGSLAWVEFALCVVTLILAVMWTRGSQRGRGKVSS